MSETPTKLIVDCKTGKQAYVPLSADEISQREADVMQAEAELLAEEQAKAEKAAARKSAEEKLAALGLTPEEISAMLG